MKVTLEEIVGPTGIFTDGDWVETKDQDPNGDVRLVQLADVGDGNFVNKSSRYMNSAKASELRCTYLEPGDILIARMPDPIGRACIFPGLHQPSVTVVDVCILRPDLRKVCPRWLLHKINGEDFRRAVSFWITGTTRQRISRGNLSKIEFTLPPLEEQRRIAAILDKADALRRKRKRALDLLDSLTQSIFLEMFGGERKGETCQLSDLIGSSDRINYGVVQPGEDDPDGIFLVRVSDLEHGRVNHSSLRKVSRQTSKKHGRSVLKGNEILISCVGSIGEVALASDAERGFNIARAVARVPLDDKLIRIYVAEYLRTQKVKEYFTKELRTVSQPTLNIKQISETQIIIPDQSELKEFERRLRLTDLGLKLARLHQSRADLLFSALQSRAFSGQL